MNMVIDRSPERRKNMNKKRPHNGGQVKVCLMLTEHKCKVKEAPIGFKN
jgi:hypothetical protein